MPASLNDGRPDFVYKISVSFGNTNKIKEVVDTFDTNFQIDDENVIGTKRYRIGDDNIVLLIVTDEDQDINPISKNRISKNIVYNPKTFDSDLKLTAQELYRGDMNPTRNSTFHK